MTVNQMDQTINDAFSRIDQASVCLDQLHHIQNSLENHSPTASTIKSHRIALECILNELQINDEDYGIESHLSPSNEASAILEKAKAVAKRVYEAIIKSLRFIMRLLLGHNAQSRARAVAIDSTISELEQMYRKFKASKNLGITNTYYRNVYVLSNLHIRGSVSFGNIVGFLNNASNLYREVQSYQSSQIKNLRQLRELSRKDMISVDQLPKMNVMSVCRTEIDAKTKEKYSIHPLLKSRRSPTFPGNWCLVQSEIDPAVSPARYGSEYAVSKSYPFIAQGYGVRVEKGDPDVELSQVSGNTIPTLSVREILTTLQSCTGAYRGYAQFESDVQSILEEMNKALGQLESEQNKGADIQRAFYKYYTSLAREQVRLAGEFSSRYLKTLDSALAHVRKSMEQYRSDLKT